MWNCGCRLLFHLHSLKFYKIMFDNLNKKKKTAIPEVLIFNIEDKFDVF